MPREPGARGSAPHPRGRAIAVAPGVLLFGGTMSSNDILCAVDFSPASARAIDSASSIARALGARIHLAHVVPIPMPAVPVPEIGFAQEAVTMPTEALVADAEKGLERLAREHAIDDPILHVESGSASREILRLAEQLECGMIVVGSHGRTGLAHLLLGSVAERVVRGAHVPVLVVPGLDKRH